MSKSDMQVSRAGRWVMFQCCIFANQYLPHLLLCVFSMYPLSSVALMYTLDGTSSIFHVISSIYVLCVYTGCLSDDLGDDAHLRCR
jgi:hypothetical protein